MDAKKAEEARLWALYGESARCAETYRTLSRREFAAVYPLVFGYIRAKYLLTPEQCGSDRIMELADVSLRQTLALKRRGIEVGEIARSCAGASSVVTKKILLMKALQEDFCVSMTPEEFASLETVSGVTAFLLARGTRSAALSAVRGPEATASESAFDPADVRGDFPALSGSVRGRPLVYLDNAATGQMPLPVMEAVRDIELSRGNVRRGAHHLGVRCTEAYEDARRVCAAFLGASPAQITFTAGTTDGIDRVAAALGSMPGGVVTTALEHHSDFVPWQQACRILGRPFRVCPVLPDGTLDLNAMDRLLDGDVSVLAVTHMSNVLGSAVPVQSLCALARRRGVRVLVDGAQSVCHRDVDVEEIGCDWFVCSGHKLGGPFGVGLLYSREPLPPVRFGGGMVDRVTEKETAFAPPPLRGEAGTPNVSGAAGLAAAIRYRQTLPEGWRDHERALLRRAAALLAEIPGVTVFGPEDREGCLSFTVGGAAPLDTALLLDECGIAVRSGDHCAQPLMAALGTEHTLRVSPAYYNTAAEIDAFASALRRVLAALHATCPVPPQREGRSPICTNLRLKYTIIYAIVLP